MGVYNEKTKRIFKYTLTPLTGKIKKYDYVGFDIETYGDNNLFYSGGLYYYENGKEKFEYYEDKTQLAEAMLNKRFRNKTFVATNLGFDLTGLFFNTKYWNNFKLTHRGSDLLLASYNLGNNNGKIKIIDTFNFVQFSVAKMGGILGSDKINKPSFWVKKENGDIDAIKPRTEEERLELMIYNKQDCKISCDFMYLLQKGVNEVGGNIKLTIASTSMDVWRRSHLKEDLIKETFFFHDHKDFIYKAYYGGRTETFKRGIFKDLYYYDINSLYPSVMRNNVYPKPSSIQIAPMPNIDNIQKYEGVSECVVSTPNGFNRIPLLPHYNNGKLCFPTGRFKGVWNHCELRKAIELGYVIEDVLEQRYYTETFRPFQTYVNDIYAQRLKYQSEGSTLELVSKLLLNSLYGKFAQKEKTKTTIKNIDFMNEDERLEFFFSDPNPNEVTIKNNHIITNVKEQFDGAFSFPIFSSYVTSYARLLMYEYLDELGDVIYMDTDSVVTKKKLAHTSKELGEMKLEFEPIRGVFVKPKFYLLDNKVKLKGVNRPSVEEFFKILNGESVKKVKFSKLKESIRRGILPNTKINVDKKLDLEDNKRIWKGLFSDLMNNEGEVVGFEDSVPIVVNEVV